MIQILKYLWSHKVMWSKPVFLPGLCRSCLSSLQPITGKRSCSSSLHRLVKDCGQSSSPTVPFWLELRRKLMFPAPLTQKQRRRCSRKKNTSVWKTNSPVSCWRNGCATNTNVMFSYLFLKVQLFELCVRHCMKHSKVQLLFIHK